MTRNLFAAFASIVVAGTLVAAQDAPAQSPASREPSPQAAQQPADKSSAAETTVTGCLVQGSGPTTFILENAKSSDKNDKSDKNAKGVNYVVEIAAPPEQIKSVVNHQVTIVGSVAAATPSAAGEAASASAAGQMAKNETDMPRFTAKRITPQSQTCSAQSD